MEYKVEHLGGTQSNWQDLVISAVKLVVYCCFWAIKQLKLMH